MKRYETIDFRSFVRNEKPERKPVSVKELTAYSMFFASPKSLLNLPPIVEFGYSVVIVVGGVAILAVYAEKKLASKGFTGLARAVDKTFKFGMPAGFVFTVVWFLTRNAFMGG